MAEITVRLIFNRDTGKKDILIDYESDDDALPYEHEKRHRQIVQRLLGEGVLSPDDMGEVVVVRGEARETVAEPSETPSPAREKISE